MSGTPIILRAVSVSVLVLIGAYNLDFGTSKLQSPGGNHNLFLLGAKSKKKQG